MEELLGLIRKLGHFKRKTKNAWKIKAISLYKNIENLYFTAKF